MLRHPIARKGVNKLRPYAARRREIPAHWHSTAMPDAGWHLMQGGGLHPLQDSAALQLTAALHDELDRAAPATTIVASDDGDAIWRLRKVSGVPAGSDPLWQAQSLTESRGRVFTRLRCLLSSRLSSQFLHDLRNPTNALSLHADLLARLVTMPDAAERATVSLRVIRDRIGELTRRQSALVSLWLAQPDASPESGMQRIVENAVHVVRGFGALHEIHLRADNLDMLENCRPPAVPVHVEVAVIALLLLAYESMLAEPGGTARELLVEPAAGRSDRPGLAVRAAMPGSVDAAGFAWDGRRTTIAVTFDELKLLLDDEPLELSLEEGHAVLRFEPAK